MVSHLINQQLSGSMSSWLKGALLVHLQIHQQHRPPEPNPVGSLLSVRCWLGPPPSTMHSAYIGWKRSSNPSAETAKILARIWGILHRVGGVEGNIF